jgi:hypothetical protein
MMPCLSSFFFLSPIDSSGRNLFGGIFFLTRKLIGGTGWLCPINLNRFRLDKNPTEKIINRQSINQWTFLFSPFFPSSGAGRKKKKKKWAPLSLSINAQAPCRRASKKKKLFPCFSCWSESIGVLPNLLFLAGSSLVFPSFLFLFFFI